MQAKLENEQMVRRFVQYAPDEITNLHDAVVVESNGNLQLIRDEETGEELYRFRQELEAA